MNIFFDIMLRILSAIVFICFVGGTVWGFIYHHKREKRRKKAEEEKKNKNEYVDDFSKSLEERIKEYYDHQEKNSSSNSNSNA